MKHSNLLKVTYSAFALTLIAGNAFARSPMTPPTDPVNSVIPAGLTCEVTAELPGGKKQQSPAFMGDHVMFGPMVSGGLQEGGDSTKVPLESAGVVGMITEDTKNGLVILSLEARISRTIFEPVFNERSSISRGAIVLSRKVKTLSKGVFNLSSLDTGAVLIECDLK